MTLTVKIKYNYGTEAIYPICETALTFARMLKTKTLTREALTLIKSLGYEIKLEPETL